MESKQGTRWQPNTYRKIPHQLFQVMTRHQALVASLFRYRDRMLNTRATDQEIELALGPRHPHPSKAKDSQTRQQSINDLLHELHRKQILVISRDEQGRKITIHPRIAKYFTDNPKDYLTIPPEIFTLPLSTAKKVFLAYRRGWPNKSLKWVAEAMGVCYSIAKRHQRECVELGLLPPVRPGRKPQTTRGSLKDRGEIPLSDRQELSLEPGQKPSLADWGKLSVRQKIAPSYYRIKPHKVYSNIYRYRVRYRGRYRDRDSIRVCKNDIYPSDIYHSSGEKELQPNKLGCNSLPLCSKNIGEALLSFFKRIFFEIGTLDMKEEVRSPMKEEVRSPIKERDYNIVPTGQGTTKVVPRPTGAGATNSPESYDSLRVSQSQPLLPRKPVKVAASHQKELQEFVFGLDHLTTHREGTKAMAASARVVYGLKEGLIRILTSDQVANITAQLTKLGVDPARITEVLQKKWTLEERQELYRNLNNYFSADYGYLGTKRKVSLAEALYHPQARFSLLLQVHFFPPQKKPAYSGKPITIPEELRAKAEKVMRLCNMKTPTAALLGVLRALEEHYRQTTEPTVKQYDLDFDYHTWFDRMVKFFEWIYEGDQFSLGRLKPGSISMGRWDEESASILREMISRRKSYLEREEKRRRQEIASRLAALEDIHGIPFDYDPETDTCFPIAKGQERTWRG